VRGARNSVAVGQVWNLMNLYERRYLLTVTRIEGHRVFGRLKGGKETSVELKVLVRGHRGAYLVSHADGTPAERQVQDGFVRTREETKTASDYIKPAKGPRGVVKAGEREALALRMKAEGKSCREIGAVLGLKMGSVSAMLSRAREAREEAKNLAAMKA
jgi:hypothetical protein